jgi:F420-non-reducing hydrogenase iron-sulfur subunit
MMEVIMHNFEPKIVGFLCNWCSYAGADLAGVSRFKCAPNVHIIRTMCSGGLSPFFILKALEAGADGVLICGCSPGDCHYREGNYKTIRRMTLLKKVLEQLGIEQERVQLHWVCASCGDEFVDVVNKMTAEIKQLGPLHAGERVAV